MGNKFFFIILLLVLATTGRAQSSIVIVYNQLPLGYTGKLKQYQQDNKKVRFKMIFNDSFGLVFSFSKRFNEFGDTSHIIGDKIVHHTLFFDYINNEMYNESDFPKGNPFMIRADPADNLNWRAIEGDKRILNYNCKAALAINKKMIAYWFGIVTN